jgi:SPP1 family predicted phage head-tail adaptor
MAKTVTSGDLKHKVVFKQPVSSLNDEQGIELSYPTDTIITWAAVRNIDVRRLTEASQTILADSKDFYVRWSSANEGITKDWLLVYKGDNYTISETEPINEEMKFIRFTAKTRTNG